jgi:xanthine dehydrogenase YagR molybdenum-binding subunit
MSDFVGMPLNRTDGSLKVTGSAPYAADFLPPKLAHAVMLQSTIARGRILRVDTSRASKAPGALLVLTHVNAPRLPESGKAAVDPPAGRVLSLLQDDRVEYNGQPIAVVVADTHEHAVAAAALIKVEYEIGNAVLDFGSAKASAYAPKQAGKSPADVGWGDVAAGLQAADARIDATYSTPKENHNPMEPHATVASWVGERLTLHDATQGVSGVRATVAKTLGIAVENVHVVSPFVGGGFGCKGSTWSHVVLAAMAAKVVGRPVKLALERTQLFGPVGGRPQTEQRVVLAARRSGELTAIQHEVISHTSFIEDFVAAAATQTRMLYACPNTMTTHRLVQLNVGTPTFARAPGEATGTFALESAMDELAYELNMDPIELRLRNYAESDPQSGKPWSSKSLRECYRSAAERFGWSRRTPAARSMRDGRALVGWGMATATYPANRAAATASAKLMPDGRVIVRCGTQELGTGTYTVMTQVAADALGVTPAMVRAELGDTDLPPAPGSGGSTTTASIAPAVQAACMRVRQQLVALAIGAAGGPLYGAPADDVATENGWLRLRSNPSKREAFTAVLERNGGLALEVCAETKPGAERERYSMHSFGAVFTEVRVDADLGELRVPRIVAAYGVGRLMNAKTARSQLLGGIVWGIGMALMEETIIDSRTGRAVNANLAEYHVPVNADIGDIDVTFIDEHDTEVNPLGAKGIGEIGITGVAAALANAAYHATGRRVRDLPITLDKLIA